MSDFTGFDLHCAPVSAGLSFAVSYGQVEAVLPRHQVSQKQHCLVVRVVQYILLEQKTFKNMLVVYLYFCKFCFHSISKAAVSVEALWLVYNKLIQINKFTVSGLVLSLLSLATINIYNKTKANKCF